MMQSNLFVTLLYRSHSNSFASIFLSNFKAHYVFQVQEYFIIFYYNLLLNHNALVLQSVSSSLETEKHDKNLNSYTHVEYCRNIYQP